MTIGNNSHQKSCFFFYSNLYLCKDRFFRRFFVSSATKNIIPVFLQPIHPHSVFTGKILQKLRTCLRLGKRWSNGKFRRILQQTLYADISWLHILLWMLDRRHQLHAHHENPSYWVFSLGCLCDSGPVGVPQLTLVFQPANLLLTDAVTTLLCQNAVAWVDQNNLLPTRMPSAGLGLIVSLLPPFLHTHSSLMSASCQPRDTTCTLVFPVRKSWCDMIVKKKKVKHFLYRTL